jgi:3-isopropylmalate dehydrogenase
VAGSAQVIGVLPGEGIGPEVIREAVGVMRRLELPFALETGAVDPNRCSAILCGPIADDLRAELRTKLDLFLTVRPARLLDERLCPLKEKRAVDVDLVLFGDRRDSDRGRTLLAAFQYARRPGRRRRLTVIGESNAEVERAHADVALARASAGWCAMQLVRAPERFDVVVAGQPFCDLLADLGAGLAGGAGLAAVWELHPGGCSLFGPAAPAEPQRAGHGAVSPLGAILAAAALLDYLGYAREAARVDAAVRRAVGEDATTADLGGRLTTEEVGDFVRRHL